MAGTDAANATPAGIPAFGGDATGLRLELARSRGGSSPFVVLHEGRHGRVFLGELRSGPAVVARFAWKLRADRPAGAGRAIGNRAVEARWQREREQVAAIRSPHVVAAFPVPPALLQAPPLWFCARTERWFHPPCPDTGAPLRVCRDEALLAACGLPGHAEGTERFLYSGLPTAPRVFYQPQPTGAPRPGVELRGRERLVAGFGELAHAAADDPRLGPAVAALPCRGCEHRAECHPRGVAAAELPAQQHLHAVAFFDVDAVATTLQTFDFAEACALLGGGGVDEALAERAQLGRDGGIDPEVRRALAGPGQWSFGGEPARWLAEVALRKVDAFVQLVDGLAAVHATGRPHLGLVPQNVLGTWRAGAVPARAGLALVLHDLGSAVQQAEPGAAFGPGPEVLDDLSSRPYLPPALLLPEGQSMPLAVSCYRVGERDGLVQFVVEAQGAAVGRAIAAGDSVSVQPVAGGDVLIARVEELRPRGMLASAALPADHPCLAWDGHAFEARVGFVRRLGRGADGHGLGVLLLRLLLVDDEQGIDEVLDAFGRCLRWLGDEPANVRAEPAALAARLQQLLGGRDVRPRLQPARMLHRRSDRDAYERAVAGGLAPFDPELFAALLAIAVRLLAEGSESAFVRGLGDDDGTWLARLRGELVLVRQRLAVEVFDAAARDAMLADLAGSWLAHAGAAALAAPPAAAAAPGGFSLVVQRENGETVREVVFDVDRVTIGRRDDNVLQLADPMVSSAHAAIERSDDGWVAVDRASTNGTEVDGIRLPVEVPQPLQDGSVIGIRPFVLRFHLPSADLGATLVSSPAAELPLRARLHAAWAAAAPDLEARMQALVAVVEAAERAVGVPAVAARLKELVRGAPTPAAPAAPTGREAVDAAAAQGLARLSRALLGAGEFRTPLDAQTFAAKLARFVDASTQGIERLLALRKALGKHLDLGLVATQGGVPSLRTAADVRAAVLGWDDGAPPAEAAGLFMVRFYDDLLAILGGLLRGNQQVRRAVRERLDPALLVESVSREAKLRLLVQAAAGSALWKAYVQAFRDVTGNEQYERELEQLLQQALPELRSPGTTES